MQRELEEKRLEVQRMQLEQQHEEQRRQREFQEMKCDAFLLNEAYVADSKVEQQAFICGKGVVW